MRAKRYFFSRIGLIVLGIVLMAGGVGFGIALWNGFVRAKAMRAWIERRARVIAARVDVAETEGAVLEKRYRFRVRYRYEFGGREWISEKIKRRDASSRAREKVEALAANYRPGEWVRCYVNPDEPGEAVLQRETLAPAYTLWFPALFVVGGLGMVIAGSRRRRAAEPGSESVSQAEPEATESP